MDLGASLILAGSANALLLSFVSAVNGRRNPAAGWLCALFALLSVVCTAILASHTIDGVGERVAVAVEHIATLSAGPTLYHYILSSTEAPIRRRGLLWHYLPALLFLFVGVPLTLRGVAEPPPPAAVVGYLALYTATSIIRLVRHRSRVGPGERLIWPAAVLTTMGAIHLAQLMRFATGSRISENIVPICAALAVFGLLVLALRGSRPWMLAMAGRYARSSADKEQLRARYDLLRTVLEKHDLFRRADLKLADLASAVGLSPHLASQAFSQGGGTTFHQTLAEYRIAEAKKLLGLPQNAEVAVEPLGMEAGFRSRSSFYTAFQKATGQSPAEYRRRLNA